MWTVRPHQPISPVAHGGTHFQTRFLGKVRHGGHLGGGVTVGGLDARDAALRGCRTGGGCDHADPGGEGVRPAVGGACVSRSREQRCALDKMWRVGQDGATFCNAAAL